MNDKASEDQEIELGEMDVYVQPDQDYIRAFSNKVKYRTNVFLIKNTKHWCRTTN